MENEPKLNLKPSEIYMYVKWNEKSYSANGHFTDSVGTKFIAEANTRNV
jgi:hypothetical protein